MERSWLALAFVGVALAGAWWTTSCVLDACGDATTTATLSFAVGGTVAYAGLGSFRLGDGRLVAAGLLLNAFLILPMLVLEFPGLGVFALSFVAVVLGLILAAFAAVEDARRGAVRRLRIGLTIVGLGTLYWVPDKLVSPDLALPPYLIAPAAFLLAAVALGTPAATGAGEPVDTAAAARHQSR